MIRKGNGVLIVFACLVLVSLAQIVWWIYFLIRESNRFEEARSNAADISRSYAMVRMHTELPADATDAERARFLAQHFPDLMLASDGTVQVTDAFRASIAHDIRRRMVMFLSEGSFFMVLTLGGVFVIYRALRHEMAFKTQQRDFVAAAGHELKTPIAAMRLALQTIHRPDLPREKAARFLANMEKDLERLESLVHMILKAGQIESGRLTLQPEPLELDAELRAYANRFDALLKERNCDLELDVGHGLWVRADREAMLSIFSNLVDNAAKYVRDGARGHVRLSARARDAAVVVEVLDDGIGIDRRELGRVFDRFYRGQDDAVRSKPGTGLGLYLVRELVLEQGGTIEAESAGRGKGALFRIVLPALQGKVS
ncbi:MAG: HAMP domain-containing sensor histidine kinase [Planctomycetota bacterium]